MPGQTLTPSEENFCVLVTLGAHNADMEPLLISNHGESVTVLNRTDKPVVLLGIESPDRPEWMIRTGLETEAEVLEPGEAFHFRIAPNLSADHCHLEVTLMDDDEHRHTQMKRIFA